MEAAMLKAFHHQASIGEMRLKKLEVDASNGSILHTERMSDLGERLRFTEEKLGLAPHSRADEPRAVA
jgi:hypothetical protein